MNWHQAMRRAARLSRTTGIRYRVYGRRHTWALGAWAWLYSVEPVR